MTESTAAFDGNGLERNIDHLKFSSATIARCSDQIGAIGPNSSPQEIAIAVETAIAHLATVGHVLHHVVGTMCRHCAGDMGHYCDGRSVVGRVDLDADTQFAMIWHPIPGHAWNRPREVATIRTSNGVPKKVIVPAPGHLDSVTVTEQ
jgi:hypothetical protein